MPTKDCERTYFDFIQNVLAFTVACEEAEAEDKGYVCLWAMIKGRTFLCTDKEEVLAKAKEMRSRFIHAVYRIGFVKHNEYFIEKI